MSRKTIEFQETSNEPKAQAPAKQEGKPFFENKTIKPEYDSIRLKFPSAVTWLRVLPAIKPSSFPALLGVDVYSSDNNDANQYPTFVSPTTLDPNAVDIFAKARAWFYKNEPALMRKKGENDTGFKLRTKRRVLGFVIVEGYDEGERLKLLNVSGYDGQFGGQQGPGYHIQQLSEVRDTEPGSPTLGELIYGDIANPETGRLVCITKSQTEKAEFASYSVKPGKTSSKLNLDVLSDEEFNLLTPLENVIQIPTEEEQKEYLKKYIGSDYFSKIFPE